MTPKPTVLLIGATGETGTDILNGLVEDGGFDITVYSRAVSASSAAVAKIKARGIPVVTSPADSSAHDLTSLLRSIDIVISAVGPEAHPSQLPWIDAAALAGTVQRFVPCGFTTICPRGGVMLIRDDKEAVHDHLFRQRVPYTIVDVGYWHQLSHPHLPSGRTDHAAAQPLTELVADPDAPTLLTDKRDIGRFLARIIKDPRTLNRRVVTHSDELSQNQIWELAERLSGEAIPRHYVSTADTLTQLTRATQAHAAAAPDDWMAKVALYKAHYAHSKYVRADNTLANALYLGYVDARALYPDFEPVSFEAFLKEVLAGGGERPYAGRFG